MTNLDGRLAAPRGPGCSSTTRGCCRGWRSKLDGRPPRTISASPVGGDAYLAYAELTEGIDVGREAVYLETSHFVGDGMRSLMRFTNYGPQPARFELGIGLAADYADSDEVERGERRQQAATDARWDAAAATLSLCYQHETLELGTDRSRGRSRAAETTWDRDHLLMPISSAGARDRGGRAGIDPILAEGRVAGTRRRSFAGARAPLEVLTRRLAVEMPRLTSSNATLVQAWDTATADLASLPFGLPDAPATPIAGLPLYLQFFGRDTLTIGWQSLMATPTLLHDALVANAAWRGTRIDDWLDEEPGKMIHQARGGPTLPPGTRPVRALLRRLGHTAGLPRHARAIPGVDG